MFLKFYGLKEQPFGVTPNPSYLYMGRSHSEALASLFYGIESDRGFMALIAKPGMGKTTLIFRLLEQLRPVARTAFLFQTQCAPEEFLRCLFSDLGCDSSKSDLLSLRTELDNILLAEAQSNRRVVLFIDEAQNLDDSVLETIRMLSNFETAQRKLFQIVLSGQPQLADMLKRPELAQLRQRISIIGRLDPFDTAEVGDYINHRLEVAGYIGNEIFTPNAVKLIAHYSEGIPRTVNNICFNALSLGCAKRNKKIDSTIVREVLSDLDLKDAPLAARIKLKTGSSKFRIAAAIALITVTGLLSYSFWKTSNRNKPEAARLATSPAVVPPSVSPQESGAGLNKAASSQTMTITVQPNETMGLITERYLKRRLNKTLSKEILQLNPHISDKNIIPSGGHLRIPVLAGATGSESSIRMQGQSAEREKKP
jgi:general secretion pathway protein A